MVASRDRLCLGSVTARTAPGVTVCGDMLCGGSAWPAGFVHAARAKSSGPPALPGLQLPRNCRPGSATAVRGAHSRPSRPRRATAECGLRVCAWEAATDHAVAACGDTSCAEARGMWHRRITGSCVRRGGGVSVRSRRVAMRRASTRVACGTGVSRVAVWGAVGVGACGRGEWRYGVRRCVWHVAPSYHG